MFGDDNRHLTETLGHMITEAFQVCRANQTEAHQKLAEWIRRDRRFDHHDAQRLADRARECGQSGRRLDFDDPYLRKGGQKRPLAR
jgi:hypothetical protein